MATMTRFEFYPAPERDRLERYAAEYAFVQSEPTPWTPLRKPLRDCRAVLVTTAGIRLKTQHEYRADRVAGSAEFRELSCSVQRRDLAFDFTNYDPRAAEKDLNVIAPVDRLKELVDREALGQLNDTFFSFYGLCGRIEELKANARAAAEKSTAEVAFLFPANLVCNQTVSIISREFERAGIPTVTLVTVREVAAQVKVPRPLFINHPFGRTLGRPGDAATQRRVVDEMLRVLKAHDRPGRMVDLPFAWDGPVE